MSKTKSSLNSVLLEEQEKINTREKILRELYDVLHVILNDYQFPIPGLTINYKPVKGTDQMVLDFYWKTSHNPITKDSTPFFTKHIDVTDITLHQYSTVRRVFDGLYKYVDPEILEHKKKMIRFDIAKGDLSLLDKEQKVRSLIAYVDRCFYIFTMNYFLLSKDIHLVVERDALLQDDESIVNVYKEIGYM